MLSIAGSFFEFDASRFANPIVIVGMVLIVLGVFVMIFRAKLAYEMTKRMKGGNDEKMVKVCYGVIVFALTLVVIGSLMAILALPVNSLV